MITHDQFEKKYPRADLIRFRSLGEALVNNSNEVVYISLNKNYKFEEGLYKRSIIYKIPCITQNRIIHLICFYLFFFPTFIRLRKHGMFHIIFINSIFSIPYALMIRWLSGYGCIQFDLMGILSEEKFLRLSKNFRNNIAKKILSSIENYLLSRVDFITTINEQHQKILFERINKPVYVIRDGIFESVLKRSTQMKENISPHPETKMIFVGQINHFRLDPLIKIFPELTKEFPNFHLMILGEGPQLARYMKIVELLELKEQVTFYGYIPYKNIFDYIADADIAYSDDWSVMGFPMKLFDYMALGKAIIVEETESIKELLIDGIHCLLYRNVTELKEKIIRLVNDITLRKKLGGSAFEIAKQHTWEKRGKELELIYQKFFLHTEMT